MKNVPDKMKAVILTGHGGFDKLEYHEDWPTPKPAPGEVLVRVGGCGLNNTDINTRTAWYSDKVKDGITDAGGTGGYEEADAKSGSWRMDELTFPRIQGADVAGTIASVGEGVDPSRVGQRIMIDPWILAVGNWMDQTRSLYFGSETNGGYAEFTTVRSENAIALHSDLSDAELATFPCAYTTAENLVFRTQLQPGETVVISGASGGVGSGAIQLCKLRGAKVIAIASPAKADLLRDLGADRVIDRNEHDLEAAIKDAANGSIDVALDVVGGSMFQPLIGALRQYGRYSTSGAISGPTVEMNLRDLVYKDLQMTGATIVPPGTAARLFRLIEQGKLKPLLAAQFPLKDIVQAQETFLKKAHVGNIVVTP